MFFNSTKFGNCLWTSRTAGPLVFSHPCSGMCSVTSYSGSTIRRVALELGMVLGQQGLGKESRCDVQTRSAIWASAALIVGSVSPSRSPEDLG